MIVRELLARVRKCGVWPTLGLMDTFVVRSSGCVCTVFRCDDEFYKFQPRVFDRLITYDAKGWKALHKVIIVGKWLC